MKTVRFGVMLFLLSFVAYSGFPGALSGAAQAPVEMPASRSIAAIPPSPAAPAGAIAFDSFSGRSAPMSADDLGHVTAGLSEYVFLHKTWSENFSAVTMADLGVPWHWLRAYAVTRMPIENR